jgi:hypothetical protein
VLGHLFRFDLLVDVAEAHCLARLVLRRGSHGVLWRAGDSGSSRVWNTKSDLAIRNDDAVKNEWSCIKPAPTPQELRKATINADATSERDGNPVKMQEVRVGGVKVCSQRAKCDGPGRLEPRNDTPTIDRGMATRRGRIG